VPRLEPNISAFCERPDVDAQQPGGWVNGSPDDTALGFSDRLPRRSQSRSDCLIARMPDAFHLGDVSADDGAARSVGQGHGGQSGV
jgi:hypothetical protein